MPEINKHTGRHLPFDKRRVHHWLHGEIYLLNTTIPQADEENLGSLEISASDYSCIGRPQFLCKLFLGCHPRIFFPRKKNQDTLYHFSNPNRQLLTEQKTTSRTDEKLLLHITKKTIYIWVKNWPSILQIFQIDELSAQNLPGRCIGSLHLQPCCGLSTQHPIHGEGWH